MPFWGREPSGGKEWGVSLGGLCGRGGGGWRFTECAPGTHVPAQENEVLAVEFAGGLRRGRSGGSVV